jgi:putative tryptophan/tyrosine transport system substrate-binding protein
VTVNRTWIVIVCAIALAGSASAAAGKEKLLRIGISQIVEHPALDATRKGFMDDLEQNGFEQSKKVEYDYKNAQNNRAVSGQIARKFVGDEVNLILAISTPSAQDAAAATKNIPILFSAVTDPKAAGLVKTLETPGSNVSGTSDRSPITRQLELIRQILPAARTLGTIYSPGEANSVASVGEIEAAAAKMGLKVEKAAATSSSMVKMATESLLGRVDAIHVPTDNTVVLALESVVKVCQENKIPLFAADVDSVDRGAIAALALDYYKLGRQTGAMARKALQGSVKMSEMPVEVQDDLVLHVNPAQAIKMGVKLPESVLKQASKIVE